MTDGPTVLIMAAGKGTRMRSELPKQLHPVCGRPMMAWPIAAGREAGAVRTVAIVPPGLDLSAVLDGAETVVQEVADGTGGALRAAIDVIRESGTVVVLSGDHPLIDASTITGLLDTHREASAAMTLLSMELEEPGSYGRVIRDAGGSVERIAEAKTDGDASADDLAVKEVNAGTYIFEGAPLAEALEQLTNDNAQGEYYLGDVLPLLREAGHAVAAHLTPDPEVNLGVNDRADLAVVTEIARRRILEAHMLAGVTISDPGSTWIDADVQLAPDVTVEPYSFLRGETSVASGSVVGPMTTLIDSALGADVRIPHSYCLECRVADGVSIGPFAYLRPGADLRDGSKVGTFVEVKNSTIGEGAKIPHLSYIGDADVGSASNLGAGTITANYDGFRKHRTEIGEGVRTGVDTSLVAPVRIGDGAYTGAGSVITEDVPDGALGITRPEQRTVDRYAQKRAERAAEQEGKT